MQRFIISSLLLTLALVSTSTHATSEPTTFEFTEEFLTNADQQASGKEIWQQQCRHCHGKAAYPGKAPKLKPRRYKPDFVYDRITNGFRKMPPWKDVYSDEQRRSIVAFIMGGNFAP